MSTPRPSRMLPLHRPALNAVVRRRVCCLNHARGFTLVEMVVSAMLLGFLAVTATFFWVHNLTLVQTVNTDTSTLADARGVLERLAREVREVKFNAGTISPPTSSGYCVSSMTPTLMVFNKTAVGYAHVDGCGGAIPGDTNADFAVSIQLSGGTLNLGYAGTRSAPNNITSALVTGIPNNGFKIRYLDADLAETTSAAALRYVELSLTLEPSGVQSTNARTLIALRNT